MLSFYGKIRHVDLDLGLFDFEYKKRIYYFYLTHGMIKKYEMYIKEGVYVILEAMRHTSKVGNVIPFQVYSFNRIFTIVNNKQFIYFDSEQIKESIRKFFKKDNYKLFIDFEFTMPPYSYRKGDKPKFISEIVQYGMCLEDANGKLIDTTGDFVRPEYPLGINYRTCEFLKVNDKKLRHCSYYSKFYRKLEDYILLYQPTIYIWGKNDYLMLTESYTQHQVKPLTERKNFVNLMQIIKNYYSLKNDVGLYAAFDLLNAKKPMEVQDHIALHDALATLQIYHLFENQINNK